jgi:hypothetical protein
MSRTIAVGDAVVFEGLPYRVSAVAPEGGLVEFSSELKHRRGAADVPRFRTAAKREDLQWSDELDAWYLWGRLLGKLRGGHGADQMAVVTELRDRRLIPARSTRRRGSGPAGGEHLNLFCALFRSGHDWAAELEQEERTRALSPAAAALAADYAERFKRKLAGGFADPGVNDSDGEEG